MQASGRKLLISSCPPHIGLYEICKNSKGFLKIFTGSSDFEWFQQNPPRKPRGLQVGKNCFHRHRILLIWKPPWGVSWIPKDSLKSHAKVAFQVALECSVVSYSKRSNPIISQARPKGDPPGGSRKERTVNKFPELYMSIARVHLVNTS